MFLLSFFFYQEAMKCLFSFLSFFEFCKEILLTVSLFCSVACKSLFPSLLLFELSTLVSVQHYSLFLPLFFSFFFSVLKRYFTSVFHLSLASFREQKTFTFFFLSFSLSLSCSFLHGIIQCFYISLRIQSFFHKINSKVHLSFETS